jgi:hypothetical protein
MNPAPSQHKTAVGLFLQIFLAADILSHSLMFVCRCNNKKHLTAKINTIKSRKEYGGDGGRNEEEIISPSKRLLCAALTHHETIS